MCSGISGVWDLPLSADDLQTLGVVAWALDYFPSSPFDRRENSPATIFFWELGDLRFQVGKEGQIRF